MKQPILLLRLYCIAFAFLSTNAFLLATSNSKSSLPKLLSNNMEILGISCPGDLQVACSSEIYIPAATITGSCNNVSVTTEILDGNGNIIQVLVSNGGGPVDLVSCADYTIRYNFSADDCANETCSITFTVIDDQAPSVEAMADLVICAEENCSADVTICAPSVTECKPNYSVTYQVQDVGNQVIATGAFPLGSTPNDCIILSGLSIGFYTITYTVSDECGNQQSISYTITIVDCSSPTPLCLDGFAVALGEEDLELYPSFFDAGSFDYCSNPVTISFSPGGGNTPLTFDCESVGFNEIQLWVTDAAGNQNFCQTYVIIQDNGTDHCQGFPDVSCKPIPHCIGSAIVGLSPNDEMVSLQASFFDAGSYSNCGSNPVLSFSSNPADAVKTFSCSELGTQLVELWVTDNSGAQNFCQTLIIIQANDGTSCDPNNTGTVCLPTPICGPGLSISLGNSSSVEIFASAFDFGSFTECAEFITSVAFDPEGAIFIQEFSCADIGQNQVSLWVEDDAGNQNFCVTTVTIQDNFGIGQSVNIMGCENVCTASTNTYIYDVSGFSNNTPFDWTISDGTIVSGQGTNTIEVDFQTVSPNSQGVLISVLPLDGGCYSSNSMYVTLDDSCIYPGDINEDGQVVWVDDWFALQDASDDFISGIQNVNWLDHQDFFARNLPCAETAIANLYDWAPQYNRDWYNPSTFGALEYTDVLTNTHNMKYADADGDAIINPNSGILYNSNPNVAYPPETDADVVHYNLGATASPPNFHFPNNSSFTFDYEYEIQGEEEVLIVKAFLGSPETPVTDVQRIGFELNFELSQHSSPNISFSQTHLSDGGTTLRLAKYREILDGDFTYFYIGMGRLEDNNGAKNTNYDSRLSLAGVTFTGQEVCRFICTFNGQGDARSMSIPLNVMVNDAAFVKSNGTVEDLSPGTYNTNVSPPSLPIELISFEATAQKQTILLDWKTGNVLNFSHFELERSTDAKNFDFVDKITGTNEANMTYNYLDNDVKANQIYYYRLKMVDNNGVQAYSIVKSAIIQDKVIFDITVQPNPFQEYSRVIFETEYNTTLQLSIRNAAGQVVKTASYQTQSGRNEFSLPTQSLDKGLYFCEWRSPQGTQITKIVKL